MDSQLRQYCTDLTKQIAAANGLAGRGKIEFSNRSRSYCKRHGIGPTASFTVNYGIPSLMHYYIQGYEYASLRALLWGRDVKGLRGVHWVVLHELAHAVTFDLHKEVHYHDSKFAETLLRLLREFPLPDYELAEDCLTAYEADTLRNIRTGKAEKLDLFTANKEGLDVGDWVTWEHANTIWAGYIVWKEQQNAIIRVPGGRNALKIGFSHLKQTDETGGRTALAIAFEVSRMKKRTQHKLAPSADALELF